jgi:hypothetical protein
MALEKAQNNLKSAQNTIAEQEGAFELISA